MSRVEESSRSRLTVSSLAFSTTLVYFRRLSCALGDSCALSATLVHVRFRRLSCALDDSCVLSAALVCSQRLSCVLGDYGALSTTLVYFWRLSCALDDSRALLATESLALSVTLVRSRMVDGGANSHSSLT